MPVTETATTAKKSTKTAKVSNTPPAVEAPVEDNSAALAAAHAEITSLKGQVSALTPEPEPEPEPLTAEQKLEVLCHSLRKTFLRQGRQPNMGALDDCLRQLGY